MANQQYELCELTLVQRTEGNWLAKELGNGREYMKFVAKSDGKIIAHTEEKQYNMAKFGETFTPLYQQLLTILMNDGWEVVSTDRSGHVSHMRRAINIQQSTSRKQNAGETTDDDLLQSAWKLRKANMLTSEEFEAVMSRLQNRD